MLHYESFNLLFETAAGSPPYPYQQQLANGKNALPSLLEIPTGSGKTAAIVLAWLWRRRFAEGKIRNQTPRRLVYCLPMRVLVEQTRNNAVLWLSKLGLLGGSARFDNSGKLLTYEPFPSDDDDAPDKIRVHMLMGGETDRDWDRYPEREAIIVGTQDMLLSRALNRGYAMSRYRWPMPFSLLHNDSLWVMDEVQLMGNGLATTSQLNAFRETLGVCLPSGSLWMSATIRKEWLNTVDFKPSDEPILSLSEADKEFVPLTKRLNAVKNLAKASFELDANGKKEAELAKQKHRLGSRTLIVVNTVKRSQQVFNELNKLYKNSDNQPEFILLHSRFRPPERAEALRRLLDEPPTNGTIAVCTQVVEAGVDVSAATLITDLAPWPSLVQRFGRCNRAGEFENSDIYWIDIPDKNAHPYIPEELNRARGLLENITNASPAILPRNTEDMLFTHVIRRKDLIDLFDTTPDLAGADVDVSRYIRENDDHDAQVFWREIDNDHPPDNQPAPSRDELCGAPIGDLRGKNAPNGLRWNFLDRKWETIRNESITPGMLIMLPVNEGGYSEILGWTGNKKDRPTPISAGETQTPDANDDGKDALKKGASQTIAEHTDKVVESLKNLIQAFPCLDEKSLEALRIAARWHDAGKAHEVFQKAANNASPRGHEHCGKSPRMSPYERPGFRHELASALAMLQQGLPDLSAYLAAAHHGKVRLSIRSLPNEKPDTDKRFARGLFDGDQLPETNLGGGVVMPQTDIDLSYMEMGDGPRGDSWVARALSLRDSPDLGPFRLAFLETLLRVADWRASEGEEQ